MPEKITFIRIFVSSPGDVNDERKIALDVIEQLPYRPAFREKVAFRVIAWDKPGAGTPMRATLTPQDAINKGLPTPAECDIVIVMFWSRMGTPFVHTDGVEYQSGTHWEFMNAIESKRPETVIYRRTDDPPYKVSDADFDAKHAQYKSVQAFFKSDLFYETDGKIKRGINTYKTPDDFRRAFEIDLEVLVLDILNRAESSPSTHEIEHITNETENISIIQAVTWDKTKSPFPGLRAFTEDDAPIFFGRGRETDALVQQVKASRFVAVVGASGSGKSSLVGAGLIPRLRGNAIEGSKDWQIVRFTPGENPFDSLYNALLSIFPQFQPNPMEARRIKQNFTSDLREAPQTLVDICLAGLENLPAWAEVLLFVDQVEELFTLANTDDTRCFALILDAIARSERVRVVVTMRADFYHRAVEFPELAELLRAGSFPLAIPKRDALRQMIERPAERAGIVFDAALVDRILDDTGDEPGNLALMAYALDELYKLDDDKYLRHEEYDALGSVQGAIGTRAENEFVKLGGNEGVLQQVFHALVEVDERGTATRRREQFKPDDESEAVRDLIYGFTTARLLTTSYDDSTKTATVEVAHEAILRSWERLAEWIEDTQDDLRLLRQVRNAAEEWHSKRRPDFLLWHQERLVLVYGMIDRLKPELSEIERDFIEPEQERLLRELENLSSAPDRENRRLVIGDRLAIIDDPRQGVGVKDSLPDLVWLPVIGSYKPVTFHTVDKYGNSMKVDQACIYPYFVSKYLVTHAQYQIFIDAADGYKNAEWWKDFSEDDGLRELNEQRTKNLNNPRDSVSWYHCVVFGRWLDVKYQQLRLFDHLLPKLFEEKSFGEFVPEKWQVRLPTEWEWQWAAQGESSVREYPWGEWDLGYANTIGSGFGRATAVGMYPHGAARCGALDFAGNLFEWCQNDYDYPFATDNYKDIKGKVLRGGAFNHNRITASTQFRQYANPYSTFTDNYNYGFRLVIGAPLVTLIQEGLA